MGEQGGPGAAVVVEGFAVPDKVPLKSPPLGTALDDLVSAFEAGDISEEEVAASAPVSRGRSVGVTIHLSGNVDGMVALLADNNVSPRHVGSDFVEAFVPVRLLREVSDTAGVLFVEPIVPPEPPQAPAQSVPGEGPGVHGSEAWNDAGFTGAGVKVGVIDAGFEGFAELMGTELPATVQAKCYGFETDAYGGFELCTSAGGDHGTVVAESIIDIAPDAELYIATPATKGDLLDITEWMITEGVSVINMSLGFVFDGPGDGTSPSELSPLKAVDYAVDGIVPQAEGPPVVGTPVVWVNAAGNNARGAWFGTPTDLDGDKILEFDGREQLALNGGSWVQLRWDGAWYGETLDLDLYLYDENGEVLQRSLNPQLGGSGHRPYEWVGVPGNGQALLQVATRDEAGRLPAWIQVMAWSGSIEGANAQASMNTPAESLNSGMLTVGAAHWQTPDIIEPYSSRGPTPSGATKPDMVGAACGSTATSEVVCGTSQASPHIAGLAALVRQRFPDFSPQQVVAYLKENADRNSNPDNTWGHGLATLPQDISPDHAALEALYRATDGDNWANTTNWLTPNQPLDQWHGVTTNPDGRVTDLDLSGNQLAGTLPPQLGNLTELTYLRLDNNQLTGQIPLEIGNLNNLRELALFVNQLTGDIPPEIGYLTNLRTLALFDNRLSGSIPAALGSLANLESLWLDGNQLSGSIPAALGNLANLRGLLLNANPGLSGPLPGSFAGLKTLEDLWLGGTGLCAPDDASFQAWLRGVENTSYVTDCTPAQSPDRAALEALYRATNGPDWTNNTNWLTDQPINQWHGVTTSADGRVTHLHLLENRLNGSIPAELGNLTDLIELDLGNNQLSGAIPAQIGRLANLESLVLGDNGLSGPIPAQLGDLTNLEVLLLGDNGLSGPIPAQFGRLVGLETLWLDDNQLSGAVPAELGSLSNLRGLLLNGNPRLAGPLPGSFTGLEALEDLWLDGTQLCAPDDAAFQAWLRGVDGTTGVIDCAPAQSPDRAALEALYRATNGPDWTNSTNWLTDQPINQWHGVTTNTNERVTRLELSNNQLDGQIPAALGDLTNVQQLRLGANRLSGAIPAALGSLTNLESLWLGANQLSGAVPARLGSLTNLESLELSDNSRLSGPLPGSLSGLDELEALRLDGTGLCAPDDAAFQTWLRGVESTSGVTDCTPAQSPDRAALEALYRATDGPNWTNKTNWLTDQPISQWRGVTTDADGRVTRLDGRLFGGNQLRGRIPAELGSLAKLQALWLGGNELSGSIPSELGNLTNLRALALHGNGGLSGPLPGSFTGLEALESLRLDGTGLCAPEDATFQAWLRGVGTKTGLPDCAPAQSPDRAALVALYRATNGPNWTNNTNWLTDQSINQWRGVTIDADGRVIHLYLAENRLNGSIPAELGNLSELTELDLGNNQLSGAIPARVGDLTNLTSLVLAENQLSGSIPAQLGRITNLESLLLGGNRLSGSIPTALGRLTNLESLWLDGNQLSGAIPTALSGLTDLRSLLLNDNSGLSGPLPGSFTALETLEDLWLEGTRLCAPTDAAFQQWLRGVESTSGVTDCAPAAQAPDAPGRPRLTPGDGQITVEWAAPDDNGAPITSYFVAFGPSGDDIDLWVGLGPFSSTRRSTTITGLDNGVEYGVVVAADNAAGEGSWSSTATATPIAAAQAPDAPGRPRLTPGDGQITVEWAAPDDNGAPITSYFVAFGPSGDDIDLWVGLGPFSSTRRSTTITGLDNGVEYGVVVAADNAAGEGSWSSTATATPIAAAQSPDRAALEALYRATDGPNWWSNTNWLTDEFLARWHGVTTNTDNTDGRVTELHLSGNQLSGSIPAQLGNLTNLRSLNASGNQLRGSIPAQLGNLTNLRSLNASGNQLSGSIPAQLGNLTNLQHLGLNENELSGSIPAQLGNLTNLETLYLNGNQLSGSIPAQLGNLTNLRLLVLQSNSELSGPLPSSFTGLKSLEELWLDGTQLCAPTDAAFQAWLRGVETRYGVTDCAPPQSPDRAVLVALYNATDGPNWINTNWLTDEPIGQWHGVTTNTNGRVTQLQIWNNELSGSIPAELGNLTNLTALALSSSQLSGSIPAELGNLTNLTELWLSNSQLSGSIPAELGNLTNLKFLFLDGNQLSGSIPAELGNLTNLTELWLSNSQLSGSIPAELGNLNGLVGLGLDGNQLSGSIPAELGYLTNLTYLYLDTNQLSGCIPQALWEVENNDLNALGLETCGSGTGTP